MSPVLTVDLRRQFNSMYIQRSGSGNLEHRLWADNTVGCEGAVTEDVVTGMYLEVCIEVDGNEDRCADVGHVLVPGANAISYVRRPAVPVELLMVSTALPQGRDVRDRWVQHITSSDRTLYALKVSVGKKQP